MGDSLVQFPIEYQTIANRRRSYQCIERPIEYVPKNINNESEGHTDDMQYIFNNKNTVPEVSKGVYKAIKISLIIFASLAFLVLIKIDIIPHQNKTLIDPNIISKNMSIIYSTHQYKSYNNWHEFKSHWAPCLPIESVSTEPDGVFLKLQRVMGVGNTMISYRVGEMDLSTAHSMYLGIYKKSKGNFTSPMMYMETKLLGNNYAPCVCGIRLEKDSEPAMNEYPYIINAINLELHPLSERDTSNVASIIKISIPFIQSFSTPFWIKAPMKLNATFHLYDSTYEGRLRPHNVVFIDRVNIVNILLCHRISTMKGVGDLLVNKGEL